MLSFVAEGGLTRRSWIDKGGGNGLRVIVERTRGSGFSLNLQWWVRLALNSCAYMLIKG